MSTFDVERQLEPQHISEQSNDILRRTISKIYNLYIYINFVLCIYIDFVLSGLNTNSGAGLILGNKILQRISRNHHYI